MEICVNLLKRQAAADIFWLFINFGICHSTKYELYRLLQLTYIYLYCKQITILRVFFKQNLMVLILIYFICSTIYGQFGQPNFFKGQRKTLTPSQGCMSSSFYIYAFVQRKRTSRSFVQLLRPTLKLNQRCDSGSGGRFRHHVSNLHLRTRQYRRPDTTGSLEPVANGPAVFTSSFLPLHIGKIR